MGSINSSKYVAITSSSMVGPPCGDDGGPALGIWSLVRGGEVEVETEKKRELECCFNRD